MKIQNVKRLYEHVFELIDQSMDVSRQHRENPEENTEAFDQVVRYMSLLVAFMAVDKYTRAADEELLRSYAPIGVLYRGNVEDTKKELEKFFQFLNTRANELEVGTKNPPAIVKQYAQFFARGDEEQWNNMARVLTAYFQSRSEQHKAATTLDAA